MIAKDPYKDRERSKYFLTKSQRLVLKEVPGYVWEVLSPTEKENPNRLSGSP
jgi:hypothetical protein